MSEGERLFLDMFLCVGWCVYCTLLKVWLDQPRAADHIATLLGIVIIWWSA